MKEFLKVSLIQCGQLWEDKVANLTHYDKLLEEVQQTTDLIIFPEMFQTGFTMNAEILAETMDGKSMQWLQSKAKKHNAAIVASLIIKENQKFVNRMVFVQEDGTIQHYDKRKLFTFSKEEQYYQAGNKKVIIEYKGWNILLQICYDLRFPELQRNKVENGHYDYDVMINVANWPQKRSLHWRTLLQARAIENQAYVIGVNRVGEGFKGLAYAGESSIITPLGIIEKCVALKECVINDEVEAKALQEARRMIPFLKDQ